MFDINKLPINIFNTQGNAFNATSNPNKKYYWYNILGYTGDITFKWKYYAYDTSASDSARGLIFNIVKKDGTSEQLSSYYNKNGERSVTVNNVDYAYTTYGYDFYNTIYDFQIEFSSTATDYIPHAEQTQIFTFEEGQYLAEGGYLADDGIHNNMKQVVFDGSESGWSVVNGGTDNFYYRYRYIDNFEYTATSKDFFCNRFAFASIGGSTTNEGMFITQTGEIRIRFGTEMTLADFKTWLTNNPVKLQYQLIEEAEIITPYTPAQQAQWNAIKKMKTYKNISHINTKGGTLTPSNDVVYYKDLETLISNS